MNKKTRWQNSRNEDVASRKFGDVPMFEFEKLAIATDHFQEENKLGRGGFGSVYKVADETNFLLPFVLVWLI